LVPDIVEAILGGWAERRVMLEKLERPLPMGWEEQRRTLGAGAIAIPSGLAARELRRLPVFRESVGRAGL
jgi:hypothetical protein